MFQLIFYVQQLRLAGKGGKWRRWQFDTAATIAQCCSQTHYNGGCYIRLTARLQYSPQPIRKYREINEEQKLTIMPQNFMPCTQSFSSLSSSQLLSSDFGLRHATFVSVLSAIILSCIKRLRSTAICFMNGRNVKRIYNARGQIKSDISFFESRGMVGMDFVSRSLGPR